MAQIFAAAAASLSGPATSRSCMPSPVLLSLITMIGRNVVSGAFDVDLSSPRHSARSPPTEFAPPTSTANSVRCTASLDAAAWDPSGSASSAGEVAATTSGIGAAVMVFAGFSGSGSLSFAAAGSGGAIIDLDGISGVAGVAAGAFEVPGPKEETIAGPDCGTARSVGGFSAFFACAVATGDTGTGGRFCAAGCDSTLGEGVR